MDKICTKLCLPRTQGFWPYMSSLTAPPCEQYALRRSELYTVPYACKFTIGDVIQSGRKNYRINLVFLSNGTVLMLVRPLYESIWYGRFEFSINAAV
jgi:hypothetical protein